MLGKLVRFDIRSTWRSFAGIYLSIILGVIIVSLIFKSIMIAGFVAFAISVTVIVVMILNLFRLFNTSVFSKEGYLTLTLPVTSSQIVVSKLIVSTMWIVLTAIVSIIGLYIFVWNIRIIEGPFVLFPYIREIISPLDFESAITLILLILVVLTTCVKEMAKLFLACSIAHLKQLYRFRIIVGILSFFVLSWLEVFVVQQIARFVSMIWPKAEELLELLSSPISAKQHFALFNGFLSVSFLYAIVLIAVFSLGVVWIMNNKLDLD